MIPVVLVVAMAIGRWWCVPLLAVGWSTVVLLDGSCDSADCAAGAAALGLANAAVGVLLGWGLRAALRRLTV